MLSASALDHRYPVSSLTREEAKTLLNLFRSKHVIEPEYPRDTRYVNWDRNCGVRIHPVKGGFRHDLSEVRALELVR